MNHVIVGVDKALYETRCMARFLECRPESLDLAILFWIVGFCMNEGDSIVCQKVCKLPFELGAVVGQEDCNWPVICQCFLKYLGCFERVFGIKQPPADNVPRAIVHYDHQIYGELLALMKVASP